MNPTGFILTSSFTPLHSVVVPKHRRFSSNIFQRGLTALKKVYSCYKNSTTRIKPSMVAASYHPPLFSIAPMMEWTDNHYRTLARLISKHTWLYTEMLAAETIVYQEDNLDRFLAFSPEQHPIVLQIGGSKLENIAKATQLASSYGYDEINFNCGCPSPKVSGHGCFGAVLMLDPKFVGEAMSVIAENATAPVTVKCRIGVDNHDSYEDLCKNPLDNFVSSLAFFSCGHHHVFCFSGDFIYQVSSTSPTKHFVLHSRKALLKGLSPLENRTIPPLKYEYYFGLLRDFPDLQFTINGGINTVEEVNAALKAGAQGVMVGRAAYHNIWQLLRNIDTEVYGAPPTNLTRRQVLEAYQVYGDSVIGTQGNNRPNVRELVKPLLGLFHSEPRNAIWKRKADAAFHHCTTLKAFLDETLPVFPDYVLDSPYARPPPVSRPDLFDNVHDRIPPPYKRATESELMYA